jgi:hypothetical protein
MIPWTKARELTSNTGAVGHKTSRLEHRAQLAADAPDAAGHAELAHMSLDPLHIVM